MARNRGGPMASRPGGSLHTALHCPLLRELPMPPEITEAQFDALVARAGIPLTPAQKAGIYAAFGDVEAMQTLVRSPTPAPEAEPSTTFNAASPGEAGQ